MFRNLFRRSTPTAAAPATPEPLPPVELTPEMAAVELTRLHHELMAAISQRADDPQGMEKEKRILGEQEDIIRPLLRDNHEGDFGRSHPAALRRAIHQYFWATLEVFEHWGLDKDELTYGELSLSRDFFTQHIQETLLPGVRVLNVNTSDLYVDLTGKERREKMDLAENLAHYYMLYSNRFAHSYRPATLTIRKLKQTPSGSYTKFTRVVEIALVGDEQWRFTETKTGRHFLDSGATPTSGFYRLLGNV